jgi:hypothetical protein
MYSLPVLCPMPRCSFSADKNIRNVISNSCAAMNRGTAKNEMMHLPMEPASQNNEIIRRSLDLADSFG